MVSAMQAVEFAQHGGRRRTRLCFVESGDQQFDARSEDERLLLIERRLGASGEQQKTKAQRKEAKKQGAKKKQKRRGKQTITPFVAHSGVLGSA